MGDRLKRMVYETHSYDKIKNYKPKIRDYKVHLDPPKPERYQLPDARKNAFYKVSNVKIKDYKMKEYQYKEYVPPWERGEIRKKKMRAVARFLPKKKQPPKQQPPPVKTEPKPKPKPQQKPKPEPKPKPVPPPRQEPKKVKPEPKPPVKRTQPVEKSQIAKQTLKDEVTQTTPPFAVRPEPAVPVEDRKRYEQTEVMYPPIDYERRMRTETEARVHVNDRPPPTPDLPLFKPTYSPEPKSGPTYNRRLHSPRNVLENLNF